jgi:hypothetical protein
MSENSRSDAAEYAHSILLVRTMQLRAVSMNNCGFSGKIQTSEVRGGWSIGRHEERVAPDNPSNERAAQKRKRRQAVLQGSVATQ